MALRKVSPKVEVSYEMKEDMGISVDKLRDIMHTQLSKTIAEFLVDEFDPRGFCSNQKYIYRLSLYVGSDIRVDEWKDKMRDLLKCKGIKEDDGIFKHLERLYE